MRLWLVELGLLISTTVLAKDVTLKWKVIKDASAYFLVVATDRDFNHIVFQQKVDTNKLRYNLDTGVYYLKVQALNNLDMPGAWSTPFKLVVTAPITPSSQLQKEIQTEKLRYSNRNKASIKAKWDPPEKAHKYLVRLYRDGKEVDRIETKEPEADFHPTDNGKYEVKVSSGFEDQYGPPITIKKIELEKSVPKDSGKFLTKKHVSLDIETIPQAKYYDVSVFKETRFTSISSLSSEDKPFLKVKTKSAKLFLGKLPPGRYLASVTSMTNKPNDSTPINDYTFDVKRTRPVEFDHVDLAFRYTVRSANYQSSVIEASSYLNSSTTGGDFTVEGNMWFPDSRWGIKAKGTFGNLLINNTILTTSDLLMAGQYMVTDNFKVAGGARLWQIPLLVQSRNNNSNSTSNSPSPTQNFTPSFLGPAVNLDYNLVLSNKWALTISDTMSAPLTHSSFSSQYFQSPMDFNPNVRIEVGAKYVLNNSTRLVAMAGFEDSKFSQQSSNTNNGSTITGQSKVEVNSGLVTIGAEITNEGAGFDHQRQIQREKFSDLDFTVKYTLTPLNYSANISEYQDLGMANSNSNFSAPTSGDIQFDATGFFVGSHHGVKLAMDWSGYTNQSTTVSYPEFEAQWAYRQSLVRRSKFSWINFFGVRSWQIPIAYTNLDNTTKTNVLLSENPQLIGPAESLQGFFGLADGWRLRATGEISLPLMASNQSQHVSEIQYTPSYKAELAAIRTFSDDLSAGLGLGYKVDQLTYKPYSATSSTLSNSSVTITSPLISIFGTYSF